ncbi:MAG: DNA alkylation repair protein [Anaerolineaceae bacterium]|nr:DNA alkylation repair protein [Anaerolineaceae bacterium]
MKENVIYQAVIRAIAVLKVEAYEQDAFLRTPDLRRLMRSMRADFLTLTVLERLSLCEQFYNTRRDGIPSFANYVLHISIDDLGEEHLAKIDHFVDLFNGWGTTDDFGTSVLQPLLQKFPARVLAMLREWNRSENMWKRRASMVAFARGVGESGDYTDECMELADNLLFDSEDLVQKAVGWALKDNLRGNPEKVLAYVKSLRRRGVSSVITLYAIRDLKGAKRAEVLAIKPET